MCLSGKLTRIGICVKINPKLHTTEGVLFLRNKIFAAVFFLFLIAVMVSAPVKLWLTNAGVVETANVGNVIQVEKVYDDDAFAASFLNAVEEMKRSINDTYTNYIPFYVDITSAAGDFTQSLNEPFANLLLNWGNEIQLSGEVLDDESGTIIYSPSLGSGGNTGKPGSSGTGTTNTPTPGGAVDPDGNTGSDTATKPVATKITATFLKSDKRHRYYQITARTSTSTTSNRFYIRVPSETAESRYATMVSQAEIINALAARRPDVNWYVFPVTCFEDTVFCETALPAESKHSLFTEFFTRLNSNVAYDYIKIDDITVRNELYFKTDHHWNAYGYTQGYRMIVDMFKQNYPDMQALTPTIHTFDNGVKMFGSIALALANYKMNDYFNVADFGLPEHTTVAETGVSYGGKETIQQSLNRYLSGKQNTNASYNHYINFFPIVKQVNYPQNNTGRNLLLIGDSYSLPLLEAISSHFDNTYIRYVDSNKEMEEIRYESFIDQHGITDVLMLEMSDRIIYDYYSDSLLGIK